MIPHYDNAEGGNHDTRFCYLGERRLRELESMLDANVATFGIDEHTAVIFDWAADTVEVRGRGQAYWRTGADVRTLVRGEVISVAELRDAPVTPRPSAPQNAETQRDALSELGERAANGGADAVAAVAELMRLASVGGEGRIEPGPLVDGVLRARADARGAGQYQLADALRDALVAAGIEVHDSPDGATWSLRES